MARSEAHVVVGLGEELGVHAFWSVFALERFIINILAGPALFVRYKAAEERYTFPAYLVSKKPQAYGLVTLPRGPDFPLPVSPY